MTNQNVSVTDVAIIGMNGRFPQSRSVNEFWNNIEAGKECITYLSDEDLKNIGVDEAELNHPNYVKAEPIVEDVDCFDAEFFGYNAKEAIMMDPQHRLFLESAWSALEDAGCNPDIYPGKVGVFAGCGISGYLFRILRSMESFDQGLQRLFHGNSNDYLSTKVAYKLNLKGPALSIQTACSTSLVAVHTAYQQLISYQTDVSIAGGVSVKIPQSEGYLYEEGGIFSPDGHCRPFDAKGAGTTFGSGVGTIVMKRLDEALKDGDQIYSIIKGTAVNNDGAQKVGYTAPSAEGQSEVVAEALSMADVSSSDIRYIETHGTGTHMGDPIEVDALKQVFENGKKCALGSVKANIGHLNAASGIAGLIKTVMALKNKKIPPLTNFNEINPNIKLDDSSFYINRKLEEWEDEEIPRRAGVSSFGIGGTNAHLILEEAPLTDETFTKQNTHVLPISAKTDAALDQLSEDMQSYLQENNHIKIAEAANTLQSGRKHFQFRRALLMNEHESDNVDRKQSFEVNNIEHVKAGHEISSIVFTFPGQGSQYSEMSKALYNQEEEYKRHVDYCSDILKPLLNLDLRDVLFPSSNDIDENHQLLLNTNITQPALFVVQYSLSKLLMKWGIKPKAMIGHSIGEYVAACLAGVFSLEDALRLVTKRGSIVQSIPKGKMVSVFASLDDVKAILPTSLSIATINSHSNLVIAGDVDNMKHFCEKLDEQDYSYRTLNTSHAFHSFMLDSVLDGFENELKKVSLNTPNIPFISCLTGDYIKPTQATSTEYWRRHLRETVQFQKGIDRLLQEDNHIIVEVGPGRVLSNLISQSPYKTDNHFVLNSLHSKHKQNMSDYQLLMKIVSTMWTHGVDIDWEELYKNQVVHKTSLPTYPFKKTSYWLNFDGNHNIGKKDSDETNNEETEVQGRTMTDKKDSTQDFFHERPDLTTSYVQPESELEKQIANIWIDLLGLKEIGVNDNFFEVGGDSLLATQTIARLKELYTINLPIDELLEEPTIRNIAKMVEIKLIDEIDQLSSEEIEKMLQ